MVSESRKDAAQEVAKTLNSTGEHVFIVSIDVGSSKSSDLGIAKIIEHLGRLDVFVSNAGNFRQGETDAYDE